MCKSNKLPGASQRGHTLERSIDSRSSLEPEHCLGHDLDSEARLWSVYVEQSTAYDKAMLKGWNDALDVLLIVAGLFSAALTAFLIMIYPSLQADPQEAVVGLLIHIARQLSPANSDASVGKWPHQGNWSSPHPWPYQPSAPIRWINAVWFLSLTLSLSAACIAMLVKQWLQAYIMDPPGRMELHARRRHFRYSGLIAWKVPGIISTLPTLLHMAFALFFVGLDILLWSVDDIIGVLMIIFTVPVLGFYVVTTIAPLFDPKCPFKTPFSLALRTQVGRTYCYVFAVKDYICAMMIAIRLRWPRPSFQLTKTWLPITETERAEIDHSRHVLNVQVIEWLVATSHDHEAIDIALRSIASLRPDFNATPRLRDSGAIQLLLNRLEPPPSEDAFCVDAADVFRCHAANSIPYLASMFCSLRHSTQNDLAPMLSRFHWRVWVDSWRETTLEQLILDGWELDALALILCASTQCDRAEGQRANLEFGFLVELLDRHSSGETELKCFTIWAMVDTIAFWGAGFDDFSMVSTRPKVVACLLRLLNLPFAKGDPVVCAIGVALSVFALDFRKSEVARYLDEESRREDAQVLLIRAVTDIVSARPDDPASRYHLGRDDYEVGGMVLCKLLLENNVLQWPNGTFAALGHMLSSPVSEGLTCRVLEALRLQPFESQFVIPDLLPCIISLLRTPGTRLTRIKATQYLGELVYRKEHRNAMFIQGGVCSLIQNLYSTCGDLSNASSLALVGLARDQQAQRAMLDLGLAKALTSFFASSNATQENLAYWSWIFARSSWIGGNGTGSTDTDDLARTLRELVQVLEDTMYSGKDLQELTAPVRRCDLQWILWSLKLALDEESR